MRGGAAAWRRRSSTSLALAERLVLCSVFARMPNMQCRMSTKKLQPCMHWTDRTSFNFHDDARAGCTRGKLSVMSAARTTLRGNPSVAQNHDRFLRGRQIAYMICEHFRATGAHEAVQGLSDVFNKRLQNAVKYPRKWSWRVHTSQNCRILFSFRL